MTRYRMPRRLAHVVTEGDAAGTPGGLRVSLLKLPDGFPLALTDTAALIWLVAAEGSPCVVEDVALGASQPVQAIRDDVEAFLAELSTRGLLDTVDPDHRAAPPDS